MRFFPIAGSPGGLKIVVDAVNIGARTAIRKVRSEIAQTLVNPTEAEIKEELRHLLAAI